MSKSKRACYVVFTATTLALASQAGAVGQATAATGGTAGGAQATTTSQTDAAPTTSRRAAHRAAKAQTAVVATPETDTSTPLETSAGDAAERIHKGHVVGNAGNGRQEPVAADSELAAVTDKGHVVGHSGNGKQDTVGAADDPACSTGMEARQPASCEKGINKAGLPAAIAAGVAPPAAPAPAEHVRNGGVITGSVVIHNGSAKQSSAPEPVGPACTAKTANGKPSSCPKGINEAGLK